MRQTVQLVIWLAVQIVLARADHACAQTISQRRDAAVLQFRAGHREEAERALRAMLAAGHDDGLVAMDLTALLQQDEKPQEAVTVFERAAHRDPPGYALLAATRAYRDLHRYDDAARLANEGLRRFPAETVWPLLLSLILSDASRPSEALALLRTPAAGRAPPLQRLLAEAYAWRHAGDPYKALSLYADAIKLAPADPEARAEASRLLQSLRMPYAAAAIAGTSPATDAGQAAAMTRWGQQVESDDPAHRFDDTDAALARYDTLLAAVPEDAPERRQLRLDRLVALHDRVRMSEVKAEGDTLRADGRLPAYVEVAYGDALLYLRLPEQARDAYNRVLAANPKDAAARYGLFYAALDLEDFATAYAVIDGLVDDQPIWRLYADDPTRYTDPDRAYAEVTAARARLYGSQLAEAWARITKIAEAAPADPNGRLALYQIANARGWTQRATAEAEIAASLAPRDLGSRIALIETAMANYRFADARRMLTELQTQYPENGAVQRLARELDAQERWLFQFEARPSDSQGGGANASGRAITTQSKLTSPPIADNWRLFVEHDFSNAHTPEGYALRNRLAAGAEWRIPDLITTFFPTQSWGTVTKTGGGATVDWHATDQIGFAAAAEKFSPETPLRALLQNITADEIATKATYRWDETRSVAGGFAYLPFTDGNNRQSANLTFRQRLATWPDLEVTGLAETYASKNTRQDVPYYSPKGDLSATGGVLLEHVLWRRYDDSLVQALTIDGGSYAERGFRGDWIGTLAYEHRWRFDPLTEFHYGLMWTRRVYDGDVEKTVTLTLGLAQRF
jgi:biofilm PGA synthesis protein PgaA